MNFEVNEKTASGEDKIMAASQELQKVQAAAHSFRQPERYLHSLTHLMGYRQRLAEERLKKGDTNNELREMYKYINEQIKQLLAI